MSLTLVPALGAVIVSAVSYRAVVPDVRLFDSRHVSTDRVGPRFVKTTVASHPRDPLNVIAAAIVLDGDSTDVAVYSTHDAGRTWLPGRVPGNDGSRSTALDPWVIFTSDGTALFTYLTRGPTNNFAVARSQDGGRTWSEPTFVPGGLYDRQFLVQDTRSTST